jgi:oxygen tolerance protein BatD
MHILKIGKISLLFLAIMSSVFTIAQQITLSVCDTNGMPTTHCTKNIPYSLHIVMSDMQTSGDPIQAINFPQGVRLLPSKTISRHAERGYVTAKYIYSISFDEDGDYTMGPIGVRDGQTTYTSNTLTITVKGQTQKTNVPAAVGARLSLLIDAKQIYVGQEVPCALRFYFTPNQISLEQIGRVDVPDTRMSAWSGPFTGSEHSNGIDHHYVEWRWFTNFQKPKLYEIAPYRADYTDSTKRRPNQNVFALFFNTTSLDSVYSDACTIAVQPLPAHPSGTSAIGTVSTFTAQLDRTQCAVGDAVSLSTILVGEGNFLDLPTPLLGDIPSELKYYDSKKEGIYLSQGHGVRFDYVVQPLRAGVWEIPSQQYTYFDINEKRYKTAATDPCYLTVTPAATSSDASPLSNSFQNQDDSICGLHTRLSYNEREPFMVAWNLFFALAFLPLLLWFVFICVRALLVLRQKTDARRRYQRAFRNARNKIKKMHSGGELYAMWIQFFADRLQKSTHTITESTIVQELERASVPQYRRHEWEVFWRDCASAAFAQRQDNKNVIAELASRSLRWLDILEKYL